MLLNTQYSKLTVEDLDKMVKKKQVKSERKSRMGLALERL